MNAVAGLLQRTGLGGVLCVLWTAVVCVALFRADRIEFLWTDLFYTWIALAAFATLELLFTLVADWTKSRNPKTPTLDPDRPDRPGS